MARPKGVALPADHVAKMLQSAALRRRLGLGAAYETVHKRRQKALEGQPCTGCDSSTRVEAALRHDAAGPLRCDPYGRNAGVVFSDLLDDYVPLCRPCHSAYDTGQPPSRALRVRARVEGAMNQTALDL
jgi:hypothetical protein